MSQGRSNTILFSTVAVGVIGLALAANAQTVTSPFAKSTPTQAWNTDGAPANAGTYQPRQSSSYLPPRSSSLPPRMPANAQRQTALAGSAPQPAPQTQPYYAEPQSWAVQQPAPQPALRGRAGTGSGGAYYPGRSTQPGALSGTEYQLAGSGYKLAQSSTPPRPQPGGSPYPSTYPPRTQQPVPQQRPQSWRDRMGFGNLATSLTGYLKLGAAATERDDWDADFIADGSVRGEVSAITRNGLEYGVGAEVRAQYDKYRRGFGGRVGDCPPGTLGCPSVDFGGTPVGVRGHTARFHTSGSNEAKDGDIQLEGAYLFLRSAYGDVTIGRDDGAAYLFSLGAPTLVAVGASNNAVDYTGLDAVKTVNEASGFSEKITYTSPRLLGDTVGVGVQFGASYAPNARACGVDYCVKRFASDETGTFAPDLEDVFEVGVALDRKFNNGLSIEATATYATASEQSGLAVFDDLQSLGLGVELGYMNWTVGGSYLDSNNGLMDGDYTAWDAGVTWKPAQWGMTLGYGSSKDDNTGLKSDQAVFGLSYDFNENYRLGTGVQYIDREVPLAAGGLVGSQSEKATAVFVEGRVTF